jgi:hypothetical protein
MHVVSSTMLKAVLVSVATFVLAESSARAATVPCPRGDGRLHNGRIAHDPGGTRVRGLKAVNVPPRLTQGGGALRSSPATRPDRSPSSCDRWPIATEDPCGQRTPGPVPGMRVDRGERKNAYRTLVRGLSAVGETRCRGARPRMPAASMMLTARRQ